MARNKLSIVLVKEGVSFDSIIKEGTISENIEGVGTFYYKRSQSTPPKWLDKFFNNSLACGNQLKSSSTHGALLVEVDDRYFVVCFGYGRNLINPNITEERFGLITSLNSMDQDKLRSLDINSLEATPTSSRIQTSKLSGIPNFDIDTEKDLLRSITGKSAIEDFGNTVSGADALQISSEATFETVAAVIHICYEQYCKDTYKDKFSWINHISPVKDTYLKSELDSKILEKLNNADFDKMWMAVPDVVEWLDISGIKLTSRGDLCDDIDITSVMSEVYDNNVASIDKLMQKYAEAKNAEGTTVYKWTYYKCLYAEIEHNGRMFVLNAGKWFCVEDNYVNDINNYYNNIVISDVELDVYSHSNEGEYNTALANNNDTFYNMDKNLIPSGVSGNSIEFCDIYTKSKQMIHIKRYGGSSVLSHLFNQGLVSADLLTNRNFAERVNGKLGDDWKIDTTIVLDPREYEVVFGIISKYDEERPHMPFFSKITLKHVHSTLIKYGYKVSVKRIKDVNAA